MKDLSDEDGEMRLVLLGPPGAGKGTQAAKLAQQLGVPHIATGDLFRRAQEENTELGRLARSYMKKGQLVPDEVTIALVKERLEQGDCRHGFLLDGFPRTLAQAGALDQVLSQRREKLDRVVLLQVAHEELVKRLSGRWLCRSCQRPYHMVTSPPKRVGRCDSCGGELYQRDDDKEETVRRRLQVYEQQTKPLVEYYKKQGKLVAVDGQGAIEEITRRIVQALGATGKASTRG
jgi:adenylate kinase